MAEPSTPLSFEEAVAFHEAGRFDEADAIYQRLLAEDPNDAEVIQLVGALHSQRGKKDSALALLQRAATLSPNAPDIHFNLGTVLADLDRREDAIAAFKRAIALKPNFADAWNHLAIQSLAKNDLEKAVTGFQRAVDINPVYVEAYNNLGTALRRQNKFPESIAAYSKAIKLAPGVPAILANFANTLYAAKEWEKAIDIYRMAVQVAPADAAMHLGLGNSLHALRRPDEAIAAFSRAIEMKPDFVEAMTNLADVLRSVGRLNDAIEVCRRAVALRPDYYLAHHQLGLALQAVGQLPEAAVQFDATAKLNREFADAPYQLGCVMAAMGKLQDAAAYYEKAIDLNREFFQAFNNLGAACKEMGEFENALRSFETARKLRPQDPAPFSNILNSLHFPHGIDPTSIAGEHRLWNHRFARPLESEIEVHPNDRSPDRRLRIGYLSGDFKRHSVAYFLESLFERHDPAAFEIHCYSSVDYPDETTKHFQRLSHHWLDIRRISDAELAKTIRRDGIDILIDLAGHGTGSRLLTFARKPAPLQITWLGYPDTTGLTAIDYRFTDAATDPPGKTDHLHSEKLIRLPRTFICYRPPEDAPPVGPLPAEQGRQITFGSFNALAKITPAMIDLWCRILQRVPSSRMILKSHSGLSDPLPRKRIWDLFRAGGIGEARVELFGKTASNGDHMALYHRLDLALDTFPYHGTATTCEALWMGVPVITLCGETHVSRVGVSLLNSASLGSLIANSPEGYAELAINLAADLPRLAALRAGLRAQMLSSPLLDARQFARDVESAYRNAWRQWCRIS